MDKMLYLTLLYDFYGELLTEKQKSFFEMYYHNDMSLSEIAGIMGITPQGVSDLIKRTEKLLLGYEEKLKLMDKFSYQGKRLQEIYNILDTMKSGLPQQEDIETVKKMIGELLS